MNILDLGFFRAIQALQYQKDARTIDELIANVEEAFKEMRKETLNKVFLSLQMCMTETLKVAGCNKYKLPHMNKEGLERSGQLPEALVCSNDVVQQAVEALYQ